jgi:hypothetical protein
MRWSWFDLVLFFIALALLAPLITWLAERVLNAMAGIDY